MVCFDENLGSAVEQATSVSPSQAGTAAATGLRVPEGGDRPSQEGLLTCEPLQGWRSVASTQRRTQQDFPHQMRWLVDEELKQDQGLSEVRLSRSAVPRWRIPLGPFLGRVRQPDAPFSWPVPLSRDNNWITILSANLRDWLASLRLSFPSSTSLKALYTDSRGEP